MPDTADQLREQIAEGEAALRWEMLGTADKDWQRISDIEDGLADLRYELRTLLAEYGD